MEVRIGVVYTAKELSIDVDGNDADEVVETIEHAVTGDAAVLWLTDVKGHRVGIPSDKVAYIELRLDDESHRVGFGKE